MHSNTRQIVEQQLADASGHAQHLLITRAGAAQCTLSVESRNVLMAIPAGILFVNSFGLIELVNGAAVELFQEDVTDMYWRDVIKKHFLPQKDDGLEVSLKSGRKLKFSISSLPEEPGQLIHLTDLTSTRMLQSKISRMEKLSSLGKMVASLAHQLRTPLSAAVLYAKNLQGKSIDKATHERFANKLVSRLKDLEGQINDMLLFAKSGSSGVLEKVEMLAFLGKVVSDLGESVNTANTQLLFKAPLEPCLLNINSHAIKGALENLITNAVVAGAKNVVTEFSRDSKNYLITVIDDGPGIPGPLKKHIFEPFYTTRSQGTGLGLAVVAAVAKSHKGSICVFDSDLGGAKFVLALPLCLQAADRATSTRSVDNHSSITSQLLAGDTA